MTTTTTILLITSLAFLSAVDSGTVPPVYAQSAGSPSLGSWLRRVSSAGADGSWLWGWAWGADNTVSVVDRSPPVSFTSRPASFGRMLEDAIMGYGIPMNAFTVQCGEEYEDARHESQAFKNENSSSNLGCPKLCPASAHMPEPSESWIAIVQRGKCSFVEKVREAQRFGAKSVVVGGDDPDTSGNPDVLVTMYSQSDHSDVKIPSTFIKFSDYKLLTDLISSSNTSTSGIKTVSLQITSDYASWEWYSPILTFLVLLMLPSALTLATLLIHRFRAARAEQRERAPEDVVNRLPWRVWTGTAWEKHRGLVPPRPESRSAKSDADLELGNANVEYEAQQSQCLPSTSHDDEDEESVNPPWFDAQTECAICLNDFAKGDRVRVLPCKHIFHLDEVDEWLIHRKKLCPVCKADVTQPAHLYTHSTHTAHAAESDASSVPTEQTPLLLRHYTGGPPRPSEAVDANTLSTAPDPRQPC
ncbi:hypothetical protein EW145_g3199 [Phellinidium pouzarii]|uniref:RING-type E3 ubiquitin transferase n=1 Tax=Phellinidium pouzarii TaxID=167371 RepID=A0A4S4L899_9AGAM|nr:hypothetical protein EW145_g3199 [Phellinidium pouzarii]